jgi:dolichyl-phosphate beta-glucosyltransferase
MAPETPWFSLVVPAYNERSRIAGPLREMDAYLASQSYSAEIVVVDDGSRDDTAELVNQVASELVTPLRLIRYEGNRGKGRALAIGMVAARGERVLFTDADLSTPIQETEALLRQLEAGADVVIGSRKGEGSKILIHQPWHREQLGKVFTSIVRLLVADVTDVTCGFKAFRGDVGRDLFSRLRIDDWSFDAELLMLIHQFDYRLAEVPVSWEDRAGTKVNLLRDGIGSLIGLFRIRWNRAQGVYANPRSLTTTRKEWLRGEPVSGGQPVGSGPTQDPDQVASQRAFYEERVHEHLQARDQDHYAAKMVDEVVRSLGIGPSDRVLEVGAGFGRFTFDLLDHCGSVVALDLSDRALETLARERDARGIEEERCRTYVGNLDAPDQISMEADFDFVVGFFLLHHLPDFASGVEGLLRFLRPGGSIGFVEPNRRNPLFLAQVVCCPDMTWAEERGMFTLRESAVMSAYQAAGLSAVKTQRFGFFPPQVVNASGAMRRVEARLEKIRLLEWVLPFLLLSGQRPKAGEMHDE